MTRTMILSASAFALAACAGKTPPPAIHYDAADFRSAAIEAEPARPVEIVEQPRFPANFNRPLP
jgi:type IV secretion system protein VirB9